MATAIIDGITTRYEVMGSGPPLLMYAPGGFNATSRNGDAGRLRQDQAARSSAEEIHLHPVRPARMRPVGRPGRARDLGALRGAGQGTARPSQHRARAHHGRLHGLLPGGGVRRGLSGGDAEHGPLSGRWAAPSIASPATSASPSISLSCSSTASRPWSRWSPRTASRSARTRAAGRGRRCSRPTPPSPRPTPGRTSTPTSSSSPAWRARCSTATPRPAPSPRICCGSIIPALIVPGQDAAHATSAARYLEECLPRAEYWDVPVAEQTEATAPARVLEFLAKADAASS